MTFLAADGRGVKRYHVVLPDGTEIADVDAAAAAQAEAKADAQAAKERAAARRAR